MKSLNVELLPPGHESLIELRLALLARTRVSGAKKAKGASKAAAAPLELAASQGAPLDVGAALELVFTTLAGDSDTSSPSGMTACVLALEVLAFLLTYSTTSLSSPDALPATLAVFTPAMLTKMANLLYSSWDAGPTFYIERARICLTELMLLSVALESTVAPQVLLHELVVATWASKRTAGVFEALLTTFTVVEIETNFRAGHLEIFGRFLDAIAASDEIAVSFGRIARRWIQKIWREVGPSSDKCWVALTAAVLRTTDRARTNVGLYFLPGLFLERKSAFKELMEDGNFSMVVADADLAGAVTILKIGNTMGLIQLAAEPGTFVETAPVDKTAAPTFIYTLPSTLIATCLQHTSPTLRSSALSLLVLATTSSVRVASLAFPLLKMIYTTSLGEEDGEFRMQTNALSGRLLLRLRDSSWKAGKKGDLAYVAEVQEFVEWWCTEMLFNLNPAKPYRVRINSMRILEMMLESHLDPGFAPHSSTVPAGYSSYRRSAPPPGPQFQNKYMAQPSTHATPSAPSRPNPHPFGWPFEVRLVTPDTTFTLLRLLLSTYTSLRSLSITLLERFPSPLPGYEGIEGGEKAKRELLQPALKMVRSGRESEASAGAGVVGLVWRKWVLEGGAVWDLGEISGWREAGGKRTAGPAGLSFLNDLMDLADEQIAAHAADLGRAASTTPMHGTLLAIRYLFTSIPVSSYEAVSTAEERRVAFHRALHIVESVWGVTAIVLAAAAPEGAVGGTIDTEEARALVFTAGDVEMDTVGEGEGSGGFIHKIILSATWRAMKEAGELLETILRLPSELGEVAFREIWSLSEVEHVGELFAIWLTQIRHRGALMALHPSYTKTCTALLLLADWPEVSKLPAKWLGTHLESIISKKISITRRSAGVPYCILSCLTAIIPTDRPTFDFAFARLLEIAESKTADILDESRVHAMNTIRTVLLDAKASDRVAPYIERCFLLSISMFWSSNWICRNVAMILYGTLVTRAFGTRRINLDRDMESLLKRVTTQDFFGRYPALHRVLLAELGFAAKEHLDDLPASDLHSSLFSVLMMLSLLQSLNRIPGAGLSLADPFIPLVRSCAKSRVWKIRDKASDALTALVTAAEVVSTCVDILEGIDLCGENELHGRLVQVLRLLEASGPLSAADHSLLLSRFEALAPSLLARTHSFSTRTTFISILRVHALASPLSAVLHNTVHTELDATRRWHPSTVHLPSAENFVTALFSLALCFEESPTPLVYSGLSSVMLEVQRKSLAFLEGLPSVGGHNSQLEQFAPALLLLALSSSAAAECRITALELLSGTTLDVDDADLPAFVEDLLQQYGATQIVPLREALLPLIAGLVAQRREPAQVEDLLEIIDKSSTVQQSIEARESCAAALLRLQPFFASATSSSSSRPASFDKFARLTLRLIQDDDPTVRTVASEVVAVQWTQRVHIVDDLALSAVLADIGPPPLDEQRQELDEDLQLLLNPSSLLFAIEKPNIFTDDLCVASYFATHPPTAPSDADSLTSFLQQLAPVWVDLDEGPLGVIGNNLICKWSYRLVTLVDQLQSAGTVLEGQDDLIAAMRKSFVSRS